jgi:hypothetical protein
MPGVHGGGRSMPAAVARKAEFTAERFGLDVDLELIPLALTPAQIRHYKLPGMFTGESKFQDTHGMGPTELDALEALYPGELARLLDAELDNYLDPTLAQRISRAYYDTMMPLKAIEKDVLTAHDSEVEDLKERFQAVMDELQELKDEADTLWNEMADEIEDQLPDLSDVEIPKSDAPGETDRFVLYDSKRDYLAQMGFYNQWKPRTLSGFLSTRRTRLSESMRATSSSRASPIGTNRPWAAHAHRRRCPQPPLGS